MGKSLIIRGADFSENSIEIGSWVNNIYPNKEYATINERDFAVNSGVFYGESYSQGSTYFEGKTIRKIALFSSGVGSSIDIGYISNDGTGNPTIIKKATSTINNDFEVFNAGNYEIPTGCTLYIKSSTGIIRLNNNTEFNAGVNVIGGDGTIYNMPTITAAVDVLAE